MNKFKLTSIAVITLLTAILAFAEQAPKNAKKLAAQPVVKKHMTFGEYLKKAKNRNPASREKSKDTISKRIIAAKTCKFEVDGSYVTTFTFHRDGSFSAKADPADMGPYGGSAYGGSAYDSGGDGAYGEAYGDAYGNQKSEYKGKWHVKNNMIVYNVDGSEYSAFVDFSTKPPRCYSDI